MQDYNLHVYLYWVIADVCMSLLVSRLLCDRPNDVVLIFTDLAERRLRDRPNDVY